MKFRHLSLLVLMGAFGAEGLAAEQASPSQAGAIPPARENVWVGYSYFYATRQADASGGGVIGDGVEALFAVNLRQRQDGTAVADVATPASLDSYALEASGSTAGMVARHLGLRDTGRLAALLDHYRPPIRVEATAGTHRTRPSETLRRHDACAEAELTAAGHDLREFRHSHGADRRAALLLSLLEVPVTSRPLSEVLQARGSSRPPARTQYSWRLDQISNHGRAFHTTADLMDAGSRPFEDLCRTLPRPANLVAAADRCILAGVADSRDGWPLELTLTRVAELRGGGEYSSSIYFHRLLPMAGFIAPPNPCRPAGERG